MLILLLIQDPLIERLRLDDPQARQEATVELVRRGERAALGEALGDKDPEVVARVKRILAVIDINDRAAAAYFPVGPGFEWTYDVGEATHTVRIGDEPQEVRVQHHEPETVTAWPVEGWGSFLVESEGGVTLVAEQAIGLGRTGTSLVPMGALRWTGEATWQYKTQAGCIVSTYDAARHEAETIETTAGQFECIRITGGQFGESTVWLAKGVGVVRREFGGEVWTLSAYRTRIDP